MPGYDGDGLAATASRLDSPFGVAIGGSGEIYISDRGNHQIRVIDGSGTLLLLSGNDPVGPGTGPGEYTFPAGLFYESSGALWVADAENHRIQEVNVLTGVATVVVGDPAGNGGFNGDALPAAFTSLNFPTAVLLDPSGDIYISDSANGRVRRFAR